MKKLFFAILLIMFVFIGSVFTFAGTLEEEEKCFVQVTSDFNFDTEKVSTFNDEKTISGTAPKGTVIDIVVSTKGVFGEFRERDCYSIEIGSSELFSQAISLYIGENKVEFKACAYGYDDYEGTIMVNRKKLSIKTQLENSIYIPGGRTY